MRPRPARFRTWVVRILVLAALGAAGAGFYRFRKAQAKVTYPNTQARKGEFLVLIRCRGSLQPRRSAPIYTPAIPNLRIGWVAPGSEHINAGDPVVRFDSSTAAQQLMQKEAQLRQAQATLDQALAQAKITAQQDQTELADAKFSVERAQVQAEQAVLKSRIEGEERRIDLGVAEQKLKVQQATVDHHRASDQSRVASLTRQRDQARAEVELTKSRISEMELKAPISGLLVLNTNCSGIISSVADCKPYKVGDNVSSNMVLGNIPDLESLELDVTVEEANRGRVTAGQEAMVRVDALPELSIPAKIRDVSQLAELRLEYPYTRSFRAYASLLQRDPRLRPGMNGGLDIILSRIPNAISIPSKALFTREGKPVVYVSGEDGYQAMEVEVLARNPDEVAVSGIAGGATVALVDVARQERMKK